ncbi:MAG: MnhB domain-containing protein [Acidimicrobiia bacterium]
MRRSLILDATVRLVFDGALVLSVYLLFAGHNRPGGGFVGGLVAAAAIALRYIAGGPAEIASRVRPWTLLAAGLALAAGTALWSIASGGPPLDHGARELDLGVLGTAKVTSATVFDTGVYLIVVGLVLMIFEALGDDSPDSPTAAAASTATGADGAAIDEEVEP